MSIGRIQKSIESKTSGLLSTLLGSIVLLYIFASLAIDSGSFWFYGIALASLVVAIREAALLIKRHGR